MLYRPAWHHSLHQITCDKSINYFLKSLSSPSLDPFQHSQEHSFSLFCSYLLHLFYNLGMILIFPTMSQTLPRHYSSHLKQCFSPFIQDLRNFQLLVFLCGQQLHLAYPCLTLKKNTTVILTKCFEPLSGDSFAFWFFI